MYFMSCEQMSQAVNDGLMTPDDVAQWKAATCRLPGSQHMTKSVAEDRLSLSKCLSIKNAVATLDLTVQFSQVCLSEMQWRCGGVPM